MATTRRRALTAKKRQGHVRVVGTFKSTGTESVITDSTASTNFPDGTQVTTSENHPSWRSRKRSSMSDIGGNFSSVKTYVEWDNSHKRIVKDFSDGTWDYHSVYDGPVVAVGPSGLTFPPVNQSGNTTMDAWGAKAVANAKPTNALVDLSTTLGEMITGGLPQMIGRAAFWHEGVKSAVKTSAGDFLNVQFSLTPIVSDMVGFAHVVDRFNALVRQYERDAGKVVRRSFSFEPVRTEINGNSGTKVPYMVPSNSRILSGSSGQVHTRFTTEVRRWFSGAFTYHLPVGYSSRSKLMEFGPEAKKLLGLEPTPETLWNLAPWSWAVDWFSSAGDVVSNISDWSTDGLVMRYGYAMEHSISKQTYYWSGTGLGANPSPLSLVRESKTRRRANPFGFGLTWGGLSPRQLAIAAALGISRSVQ